MYYFNVVRKTGKLLYWQSLIPIFTVYIFPVGRRKIAMTGKGKVGYHINKQ